MLLAAGCTTSDDRTGSPPDDTAPDASDPSDLAPLEPVPDGGPDEPSGDGTTNDEPSDNDVTDPDDATTAVVELYFTNAELGPEPEVFPVEREVATPDVLAGTLEELVAGPTDAEADEGYGSFFSAATAGLLGEVTLEDGRAHIDFDASLRETIPNASSSTGSAAFLGALDGTATQFDTVDEAIYSLDGDVDDFYLWLQMSPPESAS